MGFGVWGLGFGKGLGLDSESLLGGSWVVISRVISRVTILITHIRGLIIILTPLITTPEPPSRACGLGAVG